LIRFVLTPMLSPLLTLALVFDFAGGRLLGGFGIKPFVYLKIKSGYAKGPTAKPQKQRIPFPPSGRCVLAGALRRQRSSQTNLA
jgi:hypothetical protein